MSSSGNHNYYKCYVMCLGGEREQKKEHGRIRGRVPWGYKGPIYTDKQTKSQIRNSLVDLDQQKGSRSPQIKKKKKKTGDFHNKIWEFDFL